ncbi:hypothetical protein DFH07DRAFT_577866 [Mycena maculata]|uniref:Uncharacterized protein n=1 Tax=Mycena maculata TaxID=230809 RepID=A0AAD7IRQ7_9AGAR|nr:hypothetical protein DFH07DRAFT_577866 [Mycena maculata]
MRVLVLVGAGTSLGVLNFSPRPRCKIRDVILTNSPYIFFNFDLALKAAPQHGSTTARRTDPSVTSILVQGGSEKFTVDAPTSPCLYALHSQLRLPCIFGLFFRTLPCTFSLPGFCATLVLDGIMLSTRTAYTVLSGDRPLRSRHCLLIHGGFS